MFYDRFVELCRNKGVSPSRAAIEAGISKSLVSKWKSNESKEPSPDVVRKLAEYFEMSRFEVLEDLPRTQIKTGPADNDEANELMREMYERPELKALFKTAKDVKPEDIKYADDMLKRFKEGYRDD